MGLIDSPFQHITEWEQGQVYLPQFRDLSGSEYQECPRGRVVYSKAQNKTIVYMDKSLFSKSNKDEIKAHFGLTECRVAWKADPHYRVFTSLGY